MRKANWSQSALNAAKLSAGVPVVMALRVAKIATGGAAGKSESKRMLAEKMKAASDASFDAAKTILTGDQRHPAIQADERGGGGHNSHALRSPFIAYSHIAIHQAATRLVSAAATPSISSATRRHE